MIHIHRFIFNPFQQNTYLLYPDTKECAIVDPGCYTQEERDELVAFIESNELKPTLLLNTHCHVDHVLGNAFIKGKYNLKLMAHKNEVELLQLAVEHGYMYGFTVDTPPPIDTFIEDGQVINLGKSEILALYVPGHSAGSLAFVCKEEKIVLTGDVLFAGSIGRTDLLGGDYDQLINSIKSKLMPLGDEFLVLSGHGPRTSIGTEALGNPFLEDKL
ncbi:MBL fold metallo-hydrolase [Williamwhitmania taraxaci]|uniref:Glyoxylase, beta-lactamase superfamily II n=1 Tax=Williamwhitmania taraxaci TaxID=1640674 RepID=A0A1G6JJ92_9BACT|nr:MBL fold metallo-hydrolase [Williamwhitmania taraxaci]SDC18773.1 Glyoxylase, beta-lactamase superfamily II [Williamwhitmania taraxaci]